MACELFMLIVIFILPCAIADERIVTTDRRVYLKCDINFTQAVFWYVKNAEFKFIKIYSCQDRAGGPCTEIIPIGGDIQVNRSNDVSVLSLMPTQKEQIFQCKLENGVVKTFNVSLIDSANISQYCNVTLQSISISSDPQITFSCEFTFQETLDANLTLKGLEQNNFTIRRSSHGINGTIPFEHFNNIHDAHCEIDFPDIDETRSCTYPNVFKNRYTSEGNEIVIQCDVEYDVDWYLMDLYGRKEDIENRLWIRDGGRSLLIRDISERDVGKVVVCQTKGDTNKTNKGTIGFTVISKISGVINNSNSESPSPPPSAHNPYLVLMLLFLSLWLITSAVGGVWLRCTPKRNKSGTFAIASAPGNASNGGSGERETSLLNIVTGARRDPDTSNTNNSAHNPVFEPEVNHTGENSRNRQSNNESHLYFTLEKSSPSPVNSLPRASTARREQPDANPASLNHPLSSYSQCYETVGEPNKGATCSNDLGEYAEVGYQIQGKGPPDFGEYAEVGYQIKGKGPPDLSGRPSVRKKPGREKVKENDISSLYSKVNK